MSSYSYYYNSFKNMYNNRLNNNINGPKNISSSPTPSPQLNSAGQIASTHFNYHYLQKDKERLFNNYHQNNPETKNQFRKDFYQSYKNNNITNINTYRPNEDNKNDIFKNNSNNYIYRATNSNFQKNDFQNASSYNNYLTKRENKSGKELNFKPSVTPNNQQMDNKNKMFRVKQLMDDFDKKLYDTTTNFGIKRNTIEEKAQEFQNIKKEPEELYKKRTFSYDKFNVNKKNINQNFNNYFKPNSTLHDTNMLYKNFFQNNNNNQTINSNDYNSNYPFYNNRNSYHYNINRNSMNKINPVNTPNINNDNPENKIIRNNITRYKINNYSSYTLGGTDAFRHPKTNQDSFLIKKIDENNYIFGVFDGHGFEGHLVSQEIASYLEKNISSSTFSKKENIYTLFENLSSYINNCKNFNYMESGSTVVLISVFNNKLICANCGDSRAILINIKDNKITPLSIDHKPDLPEEKKRILESGGRVEKIAGLGPYRVWFRDADYPGLAMSRSIGDGYAHKVGVSDVPEILEFDLDELKPFAIVLGSDGVFEFIKNEDIKNIVQKYAFNKNAQECSKDIVNNSRKIWESSGYAIDDITCIVSFFD